jgi:hypothetical protein
VTIELLPGETALVADFVDEAALYDAVELTVA